MILFSVQLLNKPLYENLLIDEKGIINEHNERSKFFCGLQIKQTSKAYY